MSPAMRNSLSSRSPRNPRCARRIPVIVDSDEFAAVANEALDLAPDDSATGRPGRQSVVANVFFDTLTAVYGSARRVETELRVGKPSLMAATRWPAITVVMLDAAADLYVSP